MTMCNGKMHTLCKLYVSSQIFFRNYKEITNFFAIFFYGLIENVEKSNVEKLYFQSTILIKFVTEKLVYIIKIYQLDQAF